MSTAYFGLDQPLQLKQNNKEQTNIARWISLFRGLLLLKSGRQFQNAKVLAAFFAFLGHELGSIYDQILPAKLVTTELSCKGRI